MIYAYTPCLLPLVPPYLAKDYYMLANRCVKNKQMETVRVESKSTTICHCEEERNMHITYSDMKTDF